MSKSGKNNSVRIIGGDWRGRRLTVADVPGLRPSGDRCRETLFNWLQPWVLAADCADLFAGTGALGFEAASRGAASVLMIEKHPHAQQVLRQGIEQLQAMQVNLHSGGAMSLIEDFKPESFDIVFVDPPFDSNLAGLVLERLDKTGCVRRGGFVYVESPAKKPVAPLPGWRVWRDQELGEVRMQLFRRQSMEDERNLPEGGSE
ncbi:MAG TPA: 16S rRNA (guanine(966)-N(2))-methyltransferase RsmD [Xanthomonadales bacterium]|nr:16S rRNA (guanine(966)-N(2))-methyltransferase RsmD [Paracoccaceae bacterium]